MRAKKGKGKPPASVSPLRIERIFKESKIEDSRPTPKTTQVMCTLPNGCVLIESSSCIDPANYDHEVGKEICMKKIEDKLWELEGYRLMSYQKDLEHPSGWLNGIVSKRWKKRLMR